MKRESERECSVPLKGRCLAHRPAGCGAYQNHIADTFERLMISFREVGLTPNRDLLPINSQFPQLHSRLDDGRLSPASVPLGAAAIRDLDDSFDSPSFIYEHLDSLDTTCHPHAQRAASVVVVSRAFLVLLNDPATTPTGRARPLDGSNAKGPFTWLRRLPDVPCDTPFFAFQIPDHFPVALALDLLLLPPTQGVGNITRCTACATVTQPLGHPLVGPGDRQSGTSSHAAFDSTRLATTPLSKPLSPSLTQPWAPLESRRNAAATEANAARSTRCGCRVTPSRTRPTSSSVTIRWAKLVCPHRHQDPRCCRFSSHWSSSH